MSNPVNLQPGTSTNFPTWAFFGTTTLNVKNLSNGRDGEISVSAGFESEKVAVQAGNSTSIERKWAGVPIMVTNSGFTDVEVWTA